jgi:hypothetical protein
MSGDIASIAGEIFAGRFDECIEWDVAEEAEGLR